MLVDHIYASGFGFSRILHRIFDFITHDVYGCMVHKLGFFPEIMFKY